MARVGLVLSGGMLKGAYQIGILEALEKYISRNDIRCISAASIGALNAYAYAAGNLSLARKIWEHAADTEDGKGICALMKSNYLMRAVDWIIGKSRTLQTDFYFPLYSPRENRLYYMDIKRIPEGELGEYLKAAVTMPFFNRPVRIGRLNYYDGAIIDNIPIDPLRWKELDYIICVYFDNCNYIFEDDVLDRRVIKVVFHDPSRVKSSLCANREKINRMIQDGYEKGDKILGMLMEEGPDAMDAIFRKKRTVENASLSRKSRITGDVVVNNLNKVAQKLVVKKTI